MPQFEVENRGSYYKSYTDLILSGSPLPTIQNGNPYWGRGALTSKVSGSTDPGTDPRYKYTSDINNQFSFQDFVKEYTTPYFDRGDIRNIKLVSADSYFEDSRTPEILQLYVTGTNSLTGTFINPTYTETGGKSKLLLLFGRDSQIVTSSNPTGGPPFSSTFPINNRDFCYSFPFEKKYAYVTKNLPSNKIITVYWGEINTGSFPFYSFLALFGESKQVDDYSNITIALTKGSSSIEYIPDWEGFYDSGAMLTPFGFAPGSLFQGKARRGSFSGFNQFSGYAAVFGINPQARYKIPSASGQGTLNSSGAWNFYVSYGLEIRGWKYGLYNGIKTKISATYRRNHYGYFRDMLEQRPYTKSFTLNSYEGPLDTNGGINFISGSALSGESDNYVTASIYQSTDVGAAYRVNPFGSGIFDREYRASQPWHDDDPRVGT